MSDIIHGSGSPPTADDLAAALQTARDAVRALEQERDDQRREIAELQAAGHAIRRDRNGLAARLDVIGSDRDRLTAAHQAASARVATVEALVTHMLDLRPSQPTDPDDAAQRSPTVTYSAETLDPFLRACLDHARSKADSLRLERDDLEVENRRLRHAVSQLRAENTALNRVLAPHYLKAAPDAVGPELPDGIRDELMQLRGERARLSAELDAAHTQTEQLRVRLEATYRSSSWKLTRPLRGLSRSIRGQNAPDWDFPSGTEQRG